jgi:hypothetical protein
MQIHSISKVLALPLVIIALGIMFASYNTYSETSIYIFIPVFMLVGLYVFHGPLDHWWISKFPIAFDNKLRDWLKKYFTPYSQLTEDLKKLFEYRLTLYMEGRLFFSVGSELREVPEDVKCMVSAHGVIMTLGLDDYLVGDMDRIYLYKHPFPTPNVPSLHSLEINVEDGVIILSLEQLTNAVIYPKDYYNVCYHAYAESIIATQKHIPFPAITESWDEILQLTGWTKEQILSQIGLNEIDLLPVHITLFFSNPQQYTSIFPKLSESWQKLFNTKVV